jgi:hypothetical protein
MTKITGYTLKDGKLVPIKRRYDVSTELQRRASAKIPKLATRAKALSVKGLQDENSKNS